LLDSLLQEINQIINNEVYVAELKWR